MKSFEQYFTEIKKKKKCEESESCLWRLYSSKICSSSFSSLVQHVVVKKMGQSYCLLSQKTHTTTQRVNITSCELNLIERSLGHFVQLYLHHFAHVWCPRAQSPLLLSVLCSFCSRSFNPQCRILQDLRFSLSFLFALPDLSQSLPVKVSCQRR